MQEDSKNIQILLVGFKTPEYQETLDLRQKLLREPLGLNLDKSKLEKEANDYHLAAYLDNSLVGCVILSPYSDKKVKMRQMAIAYPHQGQGIGQMMVNKAEDLARQQGYNTIFLHARAHVKAFYEKMGYKAVGPYFKEVTLWHVQMEKILG